jgi:hypothetical protein
VPTFLCVLAAALAFGNAFFKHSERGWRPIRPFLPLACSSRTRSQLLAFTRKRGLVQIAGALQRSAITIGAGWITSLAARALAGAD